MVNRYFKRKMPKNPAARRHITAVYLHYDWMKAWWLVLLDYRYMNYDLATQATSTGTTLAGKGTVSTLTPGVRLIFGEVGNLEARYGFTRNLDSSNTGVLQLRFNFDAVNTWTAYAAQRF